MTGMEIFERVTFKSVHSYGLTSELIGQQKRKQATNGPRSLTEGMVATKKGFLVVILQTQTRKLQAQGRQGQQTPSKADLCCRYPSG